MPPTASVRLGITSDRVMWIAVSILVLTISWNGIRVGGGAFGDGFMLIAFATVVANHVRERRSPALPSWLVLAGVGFLLAAVLVVIFPPSLGLANRATVQQESLLIVPGYLPPRSDLSFLTKFELSVLLVPLIVAAAATTRRRCRRLLDLWAIGAFVNAAVAVADYVGLAHLAPYPIESDRSSGLTIHPNYLALTAVMGIPAAMMWIGRSRRWSAAGVIAVMTLLGGVYASGSRAGTVAGVGAVLLTGVLVPRFRRGVVPLLPVAGMVLVVLLAFTGVGHHVLSQLRLTGGQSAAGSDAQRSQDAQLALVQIAARPLEGVGFSVIQDAHDIYLQLLAAGGVIAMASFLIYLGGLAGAARRAWATGARDEVVAASVTITMWLVNGAFDNQLADKYLYVIPGVLLGLSRLATSPAGEPVVMPRPRTYARDRLGGPRAVPPQAVLDATVHP